MTAGNPAHPILLVDDEVHIGKVMELTLRSAGFGYVTNIMDSRQVMPSLAQGRYSLVLLDLMMPHLSGRELLPLIRREHPDVSVVVVTGHSDVDIVVECMKHGAHDYLIKPCKNDRLVSCVRNALSQKALQSDLNMLKSGLLDDNLEQPAALSAILTSGKKMRSLFRYTEIVARSLQPILITGETGVGKELFAHAIHRLSGAAGKFMTVNVAGLDDTVFSDALFGHKRGAFTGAEQVRDGLITCADGGTLFLDEIGDLSEASQVKLLRLLQEGEYYPVGSDVLKKSTARVVVATNHNLNEQMAANRFRRDLFYRLCTHQIQIPPLRERREDIPLLLAHFIEDAAHVFGKSAPVATMGAITHLLRLRFPGNVRELKSMVFDVVARHQSGPITAECFGPCKEDVLCGEDRVTNVSTEEKIFSLFGHFPTFREMEEYLIDEALRFSGDNFNTAASLLGVTRQTIANHLKARKQAVNRNPAVVYPTSATIVPEL